MKKIIFSLVALLGGAPAFSQQLVNCIQATSTPCNTSAQQGNGTQGDPAWLSFGKLNSDITYLYSNIPSLPVSVANGGTGVTTSTGTGSVVLSVAPIITLSNATSLPLTTGVSGTLPVANGGTGVTSSTGTGSNVLSTSPLMTTPSTTGTTISALPTCNGSSEGTFSYVTNAQTSPTYLGTVSTTGAVVAPVFCNGTSWVYH